MGTVLGCPFGLVNEPRRPGPATLVVVAPGIAEALIATIAGLAAAIRPVIGYNPLLTASCASSGTARRSSRASSSDRRLGARRS